MLYIRFLNLQNPLQDVEQLYKDGTIEQGDIVCQQYTDKYSHLFMNGTWVKTKYISKIAQNTEVEDDVKTLYDSIVNISTNLSDISTNLSDNYINKTQYLKDEELIASTFADINNKIVSKNISVDKNTANIADISTKLVDNYINKADYQTDKSSTDKVLSELNNKITQQSTQLSNFITKEQYLKDEELIASTFADVNNKINSLQVEIAELKEQLNNKA